MNNHLNGKPITGKMILDNCTTRNNKNFKIGDVYYILSHQWVIRSHKFNSEHLDKRVNNEDLLDNRQKLRRNLIENTHFHYVEANIWKKLMEDYGIIDKSSEIMRRVVNTRDQHNSLKIDLNLFNLIVLNENNKEQCELEISQYETVSTLKLMIKNNFNINEETNIILSREIDDNKLIKELKICDNSELEFQTICEDDAKYEDNNMQIQETIENRNALDFHKSSTTLTTQIFSNVGSLGCKINSQECDYQFNEKDLYDIRNTNIENFFDNSNSFSSRINTDPKNNNSISHPTQYKFQKSINSTSTLQHSHISPKNKLLRNMCNSCYMNSGLQCLAEIQPFVKYFTHDGYLQDIKYSCNKSFIEVFASLMKNINDNEDSSSNMFYLRAYKEAIGEYETKFSYYGQEDALDHLNVLIDVLDENLKPEEFQSFEKTDPNTDSQSKYNNREISFINLMFSTLISSLLICSECSANISQNYEIYSSLSISMEIDFNFESKCIDLDPSSNSESKSIELIKYIRHHDNQRNIEVTKNPMILNKNSSVIIEWDLSVNLDLPIVNRNSINSSFSFNTVQIPYFPLNPKNEIKYIQLDHVSSVDTAQKIHEAIAKQLHPEIEYRIYKIENHQITSVLGDWEYIKFKIKKNCLIAIYEILHNSMQIHVSHFKMVFSRDKNYKSEYFGIPYILSISCKDNMYNQQQLISLLSPYNERFMLKKETTPMRNKNHRQKTPSIKNAPDLLDLINNYLKPSYVETDSEWSCSYCRSLKRPIKILQICNLPIVLIVQLKRNESNFYSVRKLYDYVDIPHEIELMEGATQKPIHYKLISVLNHVGSAHSGDYNAMIHMENGWYQFNYMLHSVEKIREEQVSNKDAYILLYMRSY